jgi:hypothetical protein
MTKGGRMLLGWARYKDLFLVKVTDPVVESRVH